MGTHVLRPRTVAAVGFCLAAVQFTLGVAVASATTLIMPNREALQGQPVVVWGNTTQANGTAESIDCGNGTVIPGPTVADQSYITATCTYAAPGAFNAKLTVGAEVATAVITVSNPAPGSFAERNTKINMAIEDGLRFLYFSQFNRAARFSTNMTSWRTATGNDLITNAFSALAVLAIQNHGHPINGPATDIFQGVVQRSVNFLLDNAVQQDLSPCSEPPAPNQDPCVNVPAPTNIGLASPTGFENGYATPIITAALSAAAAVAPATTVGAGIGAANGNFVVGKTYAEIVQRFANSVSWGQANGPAYMGWYYSLQPGNASDGSTMGWAMLGIENATAAGAQVPAWVKSRLQTTLLAQLNNDGSLDYQADSNPASNNATNVAKTGIGLQALAVVGAVPANPQVQAAIAYIKNNWQTVASPTNPQSFTCNVGSPVSFYNKGCGYAMFNVFKGLRLYGIQTLPGIGRPPGPGPIPADDWYADYVDNLLANQNAPTNPSNGEWSESAPSPMGWSCCESDTTGITALAELILAPTAFIAPTNLALAPASQNAATGGNATVTATATTAGGAPAPGATVSFVVTTGPNAGPVVCSETGSSTNTTNASGVATCTYHDNGGAGTDNVQASIGALASNVVTVIWSGAGPVPAATNIPTLSEWAQLVMAALLLLVGVWALRRRKG